MDLELFPLRKAEGGEFKIKNFYSEIIPIDQLEMDPQTGNFNQKMIEL